MRFIKFSRLIEGVPSIGSKNRNRFEQQGDVFINPDHVACFRVIAPAQDGGVILLLEVGRGEEIVLANDVQVAQLLSEE